MLSKKENFLETIRGGHPDRFVKQYESISLVTGDPVNAFVRGSARFPGMEPIYDQWGTRVIWPVGQPGAIPDPNYRLLEDIEDWEEVVKIPDLIANCSAKELWEPYLEKCAKVDRNETLLAVFAPTGVMERLHYLMGFEDMLCNVLLEPELMSDLAMAIGEYRYQGFKLLVENVHPDLILAHDDWGSKQNLFVPPDTWRQVIKPAYEKGYGYLHDQGVIIIHHSDSFCEQIVDDMADLHIDVWQGVLPQNDIVKLQKQLNGRLALQGGMETEIVDGNNSTEEEVRAEVRRVCETYAANGYFIPSITYGDPFGTITKQFDAIIDDEIDRCSERFFGH